MKKLREKGYVEMDAEGYLTLTDAGLKIAWRTYNRHKLLTEFLKGFGIVLQLPKQTPVKSSMISADET